MIHQRKKGFTLIELIIAITILAILAVGLIAALDPVEQLTKARDTTVRDNIDTIASAFERYYAVNETYDNGAGSLSAMGNLNGVVATSNQSAALIASLVSVGELKSNFTTANSANLGNIWIYRKNVDLDGDGGVDDPTPVVCAKINSKAFTAQKNNWTMVNVARDNISQTLTTGMPVFGEVPASSGQNCSVVSTTGYRNYCAYCIELHP